MTKVILGIHGLANKPKPAELEDWWKKSIAEGLKHETGESPDFEFRLVYWANLLYQAPLHNDSNFSQDALYNSEPYYPAKREDIKEFKEGLGSWFRAAALDIGGSGIDFMKRHLGMNRFADWAIGKVAKDLAFYYDDERTIRDRNGQQRRARDVLRDELRNAIKEEHDKGSKMLIVAHSMGSIIAYDTLRDIGNEDGNGVEIPQFITIGAPLGLPHVKGKIIAERSYDPNVRTPSIVTKGWTNFADGKDPVALDSRLNDDYGKNRRGVQVEDDQVANDFHTGIDEERKNNHHKSYGYLRTPEFSKCVAAFLGS